VQRSVLLALTLLLLPLTQGTAQEAASAPRVFLVTIDQGGEIWELFGHNALLIQDEVTGEAFAWNWGLFDFGDADFVPRFLRGEMLYSMGPADAEPFLRSYIAADRSVYLNEVNLTPAQARELDAFVRWNFLPENRRYIYDYFRDNCSTRIRDALDGVLGGAIREQSAEGLTPHSYRWHSRRLVQVDFWVDQGLSFGLGSRGDRSITEWEAMFLPMELLEILEAMEVRDQAGRPRPLLGPREVVYQAEREPAPPEPPGFPWFWVVGGLLAAAAIVLGGVRAGRGSTGARMALLLTGGVWGIAAGTLGTILFLSWFTDHEFMHRNLNLLYASPFLLPAGLLLLAGLRSAWLRGLPGRVAHGLILLAAALSVGAAVVQLLGIVTQGNGEVIAVALPANLALALGILFCRRPATPGSEPSGNRGERS
jgi:hypothetical protein